MNSEIQNIKQRFEIIGSNDGLDRAIEKAVRVSPTDITVLVTGESGVGKEAFPKIIHQLSQLQAENEELLLERSDLDQQLDEKALRDQTRGEIVPNLAARKENTEIAHDECDAKN